MSKRRDDKNEDTAVIGPLVHIESVMQWPELGPDGLVTGIDSATASFLQAWIIQLIRLQREDPARAAQFRVLFGYCPGKPIFNDVLPVCE